MMEISYERRLQMIGSMAELALENVADMDRFHPVSKRGSNYSRARQTLLDRLNGIVAEVQEATRVSARPAAEEAGKDG